MTVTLDDVWGTVHGALVSIVENDEVMSYLQTVIVPDGSDTTIANYVTTAMITMADYESQNGGPPNGELP